MTEQRRHRVAVVLVTHNGARWLPQFLASLPAALAPEAARQGESSDPDSNSEVLVGALAPELSSAVATADAQVAVPLGEQTASSDSWRALWGDGEPIPAARLGEDVFVDPVLIAVDTGSVDASVDLVQAAGFLVLPAESSTPFGRAAALARSYLEQQQIDVQWLWLVHDDVAPHPGCLPRLLAAAQEESAAVCGPLVVGWGQPPRLLERGIRLTGSGRRVLGVDPGEVDQGQHDDEPATAVLAVSSTAMLVRLDVWDALNGYDPAFPMSGDDIDFCRRAHRAGFDVLVVPSAKVRHAQALTRNRRPESRSTRPVRDLRLAALHLHLAHATRWAFPLVAARLTLGTGLRALARVLRRDFGGAKDEVDGWLRFVAHPSRLVASRHRVAAISLRSHRVERAYAVPLREQGRHWLRSVTHLLDIVTRVAERPQEHMIFMEEGESVGRPVRTEIWRRLVHRPQVLVPITLAALLVLWNLPLLLGAGPALAAVLPGSGESSVDLWRSYLSGWHDVGRGSTAAAPAWLALLGALAVPFGGNVSWALSALFAVFPALSVVIATAAARPLVRSPWVGSFLALAYSVTPVFAHARDVGDFSTLLCGLLLPVLVRVAWGALATGQLARHAGTALVLTAICAFTPMLWPIALVAAAAAATLTPAARTRENLRGLCVTLIGPWLLLVPTCLEWVRDPYLLLMSAGPVQDFSAAQTHPAPSLLTFSVTGPHWWALGLALVAVLATARGSSHTFTRNLGLFLLLPVAAVVALGHVSFRVPGLATATHANPSPALALVALVAALSVATAADGLLTSLRARAVGMRHVVSSVAALAVAVSAASGLWLWLAAPNSTLGRGAASDLPAFVAADLESAERPRAVTMRVDDPEPVTFAVRSASTTRFADADLLRIGEPDEILEMAITNLIAQGEQSTSTRSSSVLTLIDSGVRYLVLSGTGVGAAQVAATLVGVPGLRQLATPQGEQTCWVWQLPRRPSRISITELVRSQLPPAQPAFTMSSDVDPGRVDLRARDGEPALGPATIRIGDVTRGWRATVDGRKEEFARTQAGTLVLDLPGGARTSLTIERVDRIRAAWLTAQATLLAFFIAWAIPSRRRNVGDEDADS